MATTDDEGEMAELVRLIGDFLTSKSLIGTERSLHNEFHLNLRNTATSTGNSSSEALGNLYTSELERRLNLRIPIDAPASHRPPKMLQRHDVMLPTDSSSSAERMPEV